MPDPIVSQGDPGNVRPFTSPASSDARQAMPPTLPAQSLTEPQEAAKWARLRLRHFTAAGNGVDLAVAGGATSKAVAFERVEPDTNYGVTVTPSWSTTVYVALADKSKTGFTVHFGSASPGGGGTISYTSFRSEDS